MDRQNQREFVAEREDTWDTPAKELKDRYAFAVDYEAETGVPQVKAMGRGLGADRITRQAQKTGVPVERDEKKANRFFRAKTQSGVPQQVYEVISEIISFIFRLNHAYIDEEYALEWERKEEELKTGKREPEKEKEKEPQEEERNKKRTGKEKERKSGEEEEEEEPIEEEATEEEDWDEKGEQEEDPLTEVESWQELKEIRDVGERTFVYMGGGEFEEEGLEDEEEFYENEIE